MRSEVSKKYPPSLSLEEAQQNTKLIKFINILMAVVNVLFCLVLFVGFLRCTTTMQLVVFGGMPIFNFFLAVVQVGGVIFAPYISGETRLRKKLLDNEELSNNLESSDITEVHAK